MNILITREACCGQDDQGGRLQISLEISPSKTVQGTARDIGESRFLQFSKPRIVIEAYSGNVKLFSIPSIGSMNCKVEYFVEKTDLMSKHLVGDKIEFYWPKGLL